MKFKTLFSIDHRREDITFNIGDNGPKQQNLNLMEVLVSNFVLALGHHILRKIAGDKENMATRETELL